MLANNCFRLYFGNTAEGSAHALLPGQWDDYRQFEKFIYPDGASSVQKTAANPPGHYLPSVYQPPILVGEMSLRSDGKGVLATTLIPTRPMSIDFTGAGDLDATAGLVVSMLIAMTGGGSMTAAIEGRLNASVDFSGSGDLTANVQALGNMVVALLGAGDLDATIAAFGDMTIDIVVTGTGLSTANVGQAVWAALAAANNDPGTMGEKLNDAGAAANPWTDALPGAYVPGSAGYILGNLASILPPAVWAEIIAGTKSAEELMRAIAAAAAGKSSGHQTNTPKYRDLDDTKDVIDATTDANGNRLTVTRDLT